MSSLHILAAGAAAGVTSRFLVQPFDVVKITLQLQTQPRNADLSTVRYRGFSHAITKIARQEGVRGLWKGHSPAQMLSINYSAAQFYAFELFVPRLRALGVQRDAATFASGVMAGATGVLLSQPWDVIRTRLVAQRWHSQYSGAFDAARKMWLQGGIRSFYLGLTPTLLQVAPEAGLRFVFHKFFLRQTAQFNDPDAAFPQRISYQLSVGSMAGLCSKAMIYPLDVVKKRLQVQGFKNGQFRTYDSMRHCFASVYKREGATAFYKGLTPTLLKATVSTAVSFTVYELVLTELSNV